MAGPTPLPRLLTLEEAAKELRAPESEAAVMVAAGQLTPCALTAKGKHLFRATHIESVALKLASTGRQRTLTEPLLAQSSLL